MKRKMKIYCRLVSTFIVFSVIVGLIGSSAESTHYVRPEIDFYLAEIKDNVVKTPNGTNIQSFFFGSTTKMTTTDYNSVNNRIAIFISDNNLTATAIGEPALYNCHVYAFKHIHNHWINPFLNGTTNGDNLSKFWSGTGNYSYLTVNVPVAGTNEIPFKGSYSIPSNIPNGSKVIYNYIEHSAVKTSSTHFTSKWGHAGVYRHLPGHAPYNMRAVAYYN